MSLFARVKAKVPAASVKSQEEGKLTPKIKRKVKGEKVPQESAHWDANESKSEHGLDLDQEFETRAIVSPQAAATVDMSRLAEKSSAEQETIKTKPAQRTSNSKVAKAMDPATAQFFDRIGLGEFVERFAELGILALKDVGELCASPTAVDDLVETVGMRRLQARNLVDKAAKEQLASTPPTKQQGKKPNKPAQATTTSAGNDKKESLLKAQVAAAKKKSAVEDAAAAAAAAAGSTSSKEGSLRVLTLTEKILRKKWHQAKSLRDSEGNGKVYFETRLEAPTGSTGVFGRPLWGVRYAVFNRNTRELALYHEFGDLVETFQVATAPPPGSPQVEAAAADHGQMGPLGRRYRFGVATVATVARERGGSKKKRPPPHTPPSRRSAGPSKGKVATSTTAATVATTSVFFLLPTSQEVAAWVAVLNGGRGADLLPSPHPDSLLPMQTPVRAAANKVKSAAFTFAVAVSPTVSPRPRGAGRAGAGAGRGSGEGGEFDAAASACSPSIGKEAVTASTPELRVDPTPFLDPRSPQYPPPPLHFPDSPPAAAAPATSIGGINGESKRRNAAAALSPKSKRRGLSLFNAMAKKMDKPTTTTSVEEADEREQQEQKQKPAQPRRQKQQQQPKGPFASLFLADPSSAKAVLGGKPASRFAADPQLRHATASNLCTNAFPVEAMDATDCVLELLLQIQLDSNEDSNEEDVEGWAPSSSPPPPSSSTTTTTVTVVTTTTTVTMAGVAKLLNSLPTGLCVAVLLELVLRDGSGARAVQLLSSPGCMGAVAATAVAATAESQASSANSSLSSPRSSRGSRGRVKTKAAAVKAGQTSPSAVSSGCLAVDSVGTQLLFECPTASSVALLTASLPTNTAAEILLEMLRRGGACSAGPVLDCLAPGALSSLLAHAHRHAGERFGVLESVSEERVRAQCFRRMDQPSQVQCLLDMSGDAAAEKRYLGFLEDDDDQAILEAALGEAKATQKKANGGSGKQSSGKEAKNNHQNLLVREDKERSSTKTSSKTKKSKKSKKNKKNKKEKKKKSGFSSMFSFSSNDADEDEDEDEDEDGAADKVVVGAVDINALANEQGVSVAEKLVTLSAWRDQGRVQSEADFKKAKAIVLAASKGGDPAAPAVAKPAAKTSSSWFGSKKKGAGAVVEKRAEVAKKEEGGTAFDEDDEDDEEEENDDGLERRIDSSDGLAYTKEEFAGEYGDGTDEKWKRSELDDP